MGTTSHPTITAQLLAAVVEVGADPFKLLVVGQIGASGTAVSGELYTDLDSITNDELKTRFGTNSDMTNRILKVRDVCNGNYSIYGIALAPSGTGVASTLDLAYSGTATEDRTMTIKPVSAEQFSFTIDIFTGDTAADIATAIKAKLDALEETFPVTSVDDTLGTLTLTAVDVGSLGNKYTVTHSDIPAGITVNTNSASSRDQFSGGANNPVTTGIFDDVQAIRFHSVCWPWEDDYSEVEDLLESRNVIQNSVLHGIAFIGYDDTEANIKDKVNGTTPLNSPNLVFMGNRTVDSVDAFVEPADWRVAEFCAIEGLRLTDGAAISAYVATTAALDVSGGSALASLAYHMTPLASTEPVDPALLFDYEEQENLEDDGYTLIGVNPTASSTVMGNVVTTYKFNTLGVDDVSFKYLNYIRTGYYALELFFNTLKATYGQTRLTEGDLINGRDMANAESIAAKYLEIYTTLGGADYVLTQSGGDAQAYFFDNLSIDIDLSTGEITSTGQLPIVTQIRSFNMTFQLAFSIG